MENWRKETIKIVERIREADTDAEVLRLWRQVTSELPLREVVWAHKQVSSRLVDVLTRI